MPKFFSSGDAMFGFLKSRRNKNNEIVLRPIWSRVLALLGILAVTGWLATALAVMIFVQKKHDYQGGQYVDIVFPWRWPDYRVAWGEEFIKRGLEMIEEGEVQKGVHFVRVGYGKSPTNLEGRKVMADLYVASNRPDLAARTLREGLPFAGDDVDYLRGTLRLLLANQEDQGVQEVVSKILPEVPELSPYNQIAALAGATAHFHRGNYDQAEVLLKEYALHTNPEGMILLARINWERGDKQAALDQLEAQVENLTDNDDIYALLSRYYRDLGNTTRAHSLAVLRQINKPMSASPRIALLYSYFESEDTEWIQRETESILQEFSDDQFALIALGEFAAHTGNSDLVLEILQIFDRSGWPLDTGAILVVETYLEKDNYREAINFLEAHIKNNENFQARHEAVVSGLFSVAHLGLENNDTGEMYLTQFLNGRPLRAESYIIISGRLIDMGRNEQARRVLSHAHQIDPMNQAALIGLIRLDLEGGRTDNLVTYIEKLMTMRKPPRALLEESALRLSGDQFLFLQNRNSLLRSILSLMDGEDPTHS